MYKQFVKQAIGQLKEAPLVSLISIVGTALCDRRGAGVGVGIPDQCGGLRPGVEPGSYVVRLGYGRRIKRWLGNRNRSNMSAEVVKECFIPCGNRRRWRPTEGEPSGLVAGKTAFQGI